jgi:hypothetical protein
MSGAWVDLHTVDILTHAPPQNPDLKIHFQIPKTILDFSLVLDKTTVSISVKNPALGVDSIDLSLAGDNYQQLFSVGQLLLDFVHALPKPRLLFIVGGEEVTHMQLKDNATLSIAIAASDAKGNPTKLDPAAVPAWALDDATFGDLVPAADGMSAVFTPNGKLGDLNVQVSIPAVGSEPALSGSLPVTVIASDAVAITLTGTAS